MLTNEENLLKDRIRHLLRVKKCPIARLGDNDTLRARYGRQINGDAQVPFTTIRLILYMFQDISADWLVMGEGHMLKAEHYAPHVYTQHNEVKGNSAGGDINVGPDTIVTKKTVDELEAKVSELERDKEFLKSLLAAHAAGITQK